MSDGTANPIRVRKLGHVGLYCRNLERMVEFYTRVLGFQVSDTNERGMVFLRFGSDHHSFVLAPMSAEDRDRAPGPNRHEGPGGNYTIEFEDPEGNRLQFFSDMDQIGSDGKSRPRAEWRRFTV